MRTRRFAGGGGGVWVESVKRRRTLYRMCTYIHYVYEIGQMQPHLQKFSYILWTTYLSNDYFRDLHAVYCCAPDSHAKSVLNWCVLNWCVLNWCVLNWCVLRWSVLNAMGSGVRTTCVTDSDPFDYRGCPVPRVRDPHLHGDRECYHHHSDRGRCTH